MFAISSLKYDEDRLKQNLMFNFASVNLIVKLKMCGYGFQGTSKAVHSGS